MPTQQPNSSHDTEETRDMIAEAACRFGRLMETALLHHLTRTVDTNDTRKENTTETQPLPTPSELLDEITDFSRELTDVAFFGDDVYELCLPLIFAGGWQVTIHARPQDDGTFLICGYDSKAHDIFLSSDNKKQEEKLVRFFDWMPIEERNDFGLSVICTRKELPSMIHIFGIFLQTLSFIRFLNK